MMLFVYLVAMLGVVLWCGAVCVLVFRQRLYPRWLRYAHYLVVALMLPGLVSDIGSMYPGSAFLLWAAWLYPTVFLLAAAASFASLKRDGFRWWLLSVTVFNLLLGVIYLGRYLSYWGLLLGLPFDGLLVSYAIVQSLCSFFLYLFYPVFNNLPVLLLPASEKPGWVRGLNLLPVAVCALFVVSVLAFYPSGWRIASSWQQPVTEAEIVRRPDFRAGVVLRVTSGFLPMDEHFQSEDVYIQDLGLRAVNLFVPHDLMTNQIKAATLGRFLDRLRERDVTIILTAEYPAAWTSGSSSVSVTRQDVLTAMLPFHRFLAESYHPDVLVPFIEPYGASVAVMGKAFPAAKWIEILDAARKAIRESNLAVRSAVYVSNSEKDLELYRQLCGPDSPVDVVGFSYYAMYEPREQTEAVLSRLEGWMKEYGRGCEHWMFEFGQSPLTMGGERAQSQYVQLVTAWAARQPDMKGACVFALGDYEEKLGLLNSVGRKRPAYHDYRRLVAKLGGR